MRAMTSRAWSSVPSQFMFPSTQFGSSALSGYAAQRVSLSISQKGAVGAECGTSELTVR